MFYISFAFTFITKYVPITLDYIRGMTQIQMVNSLQSKYTFNVIVMANLFIATKCKIYVHISMSSAILFILLYAYYS